MYFLTLALAFTDHLISGFYNIINNTEDISLLWLTLHFLERGKSVSSFVSTFMEVDDSNSFDVLIFMYS